MTKIESAAWMWQQRSNLPKSSYDANGKLVLIHDPETNTIIPDDKSLAWAEHEHPNESDGDKYRLAQAHALIRAFEDGTL